MHFLGVTVSEAFFGRDPPWQVPVRPASLQATCARADPRACASNHLSRLVGPDLSAAGSSGNEELLSTYKNLKFGLFRGSFKLV